MTALTPEQIAAIATQAALAAVQAATEGAQAPSTSAAPASNEDAGHMDAIQQQKAEQRAVKDRIDALVSELLPLIMQPRHLEVFRWMAGGDWSGTLTHILRNEIARQTPDFREAQGKGGNSSRNLEALAERIPVKR